MRMKWHLGVIVSACILFTTLASHAQWTQEAKILPADGSASQYFGGRVAISGSTVIVSAASDCDNGYKSGAAYIFQDTGSGWSQAAKLLASDGAAEDFFGGGAISGSTAIVGATRHDANGTDSGAAYIFTGSGGAWTQVAKLLPDDNAAGDNFGSVDISGTTAIIGAVHDDDQGNTSGSAYIFEETDAGWVQVAKLLPSDGAAYDYFGGSVAINGSMAIVSSSGDDNSKGQDCGAAYIFQDTGSAWTQVAKLVPADGAPDDRFAFRGVAIEGNKAVVGSVSDDDNGDSSGSAYVFSDTGSGWDQVAKLLPDDGAAGDSFGCSVALSGSTAFVGAISDDDNGSSSGSAYVFSDTGSGWDQVAKILPEDGVDSAEFGCSVAIEGSTMVIGAQRDDDNGYSSGSAYIYVPEPATLGLLGLGALALLRRKRK